MYQLFTSPPKKYLSHILSEADVQTQRKVQMLAGDRELEIEAAIYSSDLNVGKRRPIKSIRQVQEELQRKLAAIGTEMGDIDKKVGEVDYSALDAQHWRQDSKETHEAKEFVKRLNEGQRLARRRMRNEQKRILDLF